MVMAVDTFGGWPYAALLTLKKLEREEDKTVRHLHQQLSVVMIRDNLTMLLARAPSLPGPIIIDKL